MSATTSQTSVSCNGGSNGSATVSVTGGAGGYTYSWSPSGGTGATASGLAVGTYTVTYNRSSSGLCAAYSNSTTVSIVNSGTISLSSASGTNSQSNCLYSIFCDFLPNAMSYYSY